MKKTLLVTLVSLNLVALGVLVVSLSTPTVAQENQRSVHISDLEYGAIDADGDGSYAFGDDWIVEWLVNNQPNVLNRALDQAVVNPDGGIDISAHLRTFTAEAIEAQRTN